MQPEPSRATRLDPSAVDARDHPKLSVVIPCYNEEPVLPLLQQRLTEQLEALQVAWEVVFVDDGSTDRTFEHLAGYHRQDPRFRVVGLSRNFGHQAALSAGLSYARGDSIAVMDADLQDPPEVLVRCFRLWEAGQADVVYAVRQKRKESLLLRAAYGGFYRGLQLLSDVHIPLDSGDFCLMDRRVANVLLSMPERNMFVRGMRAWAGFRQVAVPYERPGRVAGETKYPVRKLARLAFDGIFAFSAAPLRIATWAGLTIVVLNALGIVFVLLWRILEFPFMGRTAQELPGWAGLAAVALFLGASQLLLIGILGEYLARIYDEVKRRPRWVVGAALGVERPPAGVE